jgi:hypothetical protein
MSFFNKNQIKSNPIHFRYYLVNLELILLYCYRKQAFYSSLFYMNYLFHDLKIVQNFCLFFLILVSNEVLFNSGINANNFFNKKN